MKKAFFMNIVEATATVLIKLLYENNTSFLRQEEAGNFIKLLPELVQFMTRFLSRH